MPVLEERQLELAHRRALDTRVRVAEGVALRDRLVVLVAHVDPAEEPDAPVDDHDLAVVAELEPRQQSAEHDRVEARILAARLEKRT